MKLKNVNVGLGITGSFCNLSNLEEIVNSLKREGVKNIIPIVSYSIQEETNRFGNPNETIELLESITDNKVVDTLSKAEPIGPNNLIDIMVISPCTRKYSCKNGKRYN